MLKQLLASTVTLGLLSASPAMALDAGHQQIIDTLEAKGVYVEINPPQVCDKVKTDTSYHGVYIYSDRHSTPLMGICQDFGGQGEEVELWTDNDLDTLRHESVHYIQDCISGTVDGELDPLYDGPGGLSPIDYSIKDVIGEIGEAQATNIITRYESMDASQDVIVLEIEAFFLASTQSASDIANVMNGACPTP